MQMLVQGWIRGSVRLEGDDIVLTPKGSDYLLPGQELPIQLAGVRSPGEAVAVAQRFGLLRKGWKETTQTTGDLREPYDDWRQVALDLNHIMGLVIDLRLAMSGNTNGVERLREARSKVIQNDPADDDDRVQQWATITIAALMTQGIGDVEYRLEVIHRRDPSRPVELGTWMRTLAPATMLSAAYGELAEYIDSTQARELRHCADCDRIFLVGDPRQRYCNTTCANRAAYHRRAHRRRSRLRNEPALDTDSDLLYAR